ncbi:MAG: SOUL family heme-binding protein [Janthinobacterium lividum]
MGHIALMSLFGTLFVSACSVVGIRSGTEEPHYDVVERVGDAELRAYAPRLAAETVVSGSAEAARGEGFRRLAGYIFGGNAGGSRIAMTAPVAQADAGAGQRIEMTAPVAQAPTGAGWSIRFYLPADIADPPAPRDARVRIVTIPGETMAVLRFSGVASDGAIAAQRARLLGLLAPGVWAPSGPPVTWFYDPPWTLPPFRRNEVAVPVARQPK